MVGDSSLVFEPQGEGSGLDSSSSCDNGMLILFLIGFGDASNTRISKGDVCDCSGVDFAGTV